MIAGAANAQHISGPTLKRLQDTGGFALGYRESSVPFSFIGDDGVPQGYAFDLCTRVIEIIEERIGRELEINYVPVTTANRIPLVANGTVTMECGSTTNKLSRQEQVAFGPTYFFTGTRLATRTDSGITEAEDLSDKVVGVLQGSSNEQALRALDEEQDLGIRFVYVKDYAEGFLSLQTDRIDALAGDGSPMSVFARTRTDDPEAYAVVGRFLTPDPYAAMYGRGDPDFDLEVKRAFAELFRSGEAEEIYRRWFDEYDIEFDDTIRTAFRLQAIPE